MLSAWIKYQKTVSCGEKIAIVNGRSLENDELQVSRNNRIVVPHG
jgi:acyl-ACP thioesterase